MNMNFWWNPSLVTFSCFFLRLFVDNRETREMETEIKQELTLSSLSLTSVISTSSLDWDLRSLQPSSSLVSFGEASSFLWKITWIYKCVEINLTGSPWTRSNRAAQWSWWQRSQWRDPCCRQSLEIEISDEKQGRYFFKLQIVNSFLKKINILIVFSSPTQLILSDQVILASFVIFVITLWSGSK